MAGLYRLFAYFLGLTKFKSVDFFDEHVQLNSKTSKISINISQVTKTRIGGILLSYFGRGTGTRTRDLRFWRPSLYQLSYTPITKDGYAFLMY